MTELSLYKWLHNNKVECHYSFDYSGLWACIDYPDLTSFHALCDPSLFDDGGRDCKLLSGYIALDLVPIAEYYGIEIENVMPKTEENQ